ncbi:hypothetical protein NP493_732g01000 [Ridgeia piscesae]|uniref:Uncharacterized protein n=1 Tax=Ridgeia piscesae TaxID=27915 RepID=A0AAD9NM68_RIDPI|nr:hypothetical protein NP493_732g01000 [Ridgeia piscesae]
MPLLDSDLPEPTTPKNNMAAADIVDEEFRTRSGSGGFRNLFRKRQKSGDETKVKSPVPSSGSKVRSFLDAFRPRSKSDVASLNIPGGRHRSSSVTSEQDLYTSKSPPPVAPGFSKSLTTTMTPMSNLLVENSVQNMQQSNGTDRVSALTLVEKFRHRAYTDPKQKSRMAAIAARNAYRKQRAGMSSSSSPPYSSSAGELL